MPIGVITNVLAVVVGGIIGTVIGPRLSPHIKEGLNTIFGVCAMAMGISSIVLMENMPALVLSVIAGACIGLAIHLGDRITAGAMHMQRLISRVMGDKMMSGSTMDREEYELTLVTVIVLFCASGTGIYGSIVSGMTGDHSILFAKSILDLPTALIFSCALGGVVAFIAIPQLIIFLLLFLLAGTIYPYCTPYMINDFKACGGVLLLATGFRMIRVKEFPIADMIPAMILVMPVSYAWVTYILPLVAG